MDGIFSKEEAARYFKVSLPAFDKFASKHPAIKHGQDIIIKKLNECVEKESAKAGSDKEE